MRSKKPLTLPLLVLLFVSLIRVFPASAGWQINPIRLDFDQRTRSGVITISNTGNEKITFAAEAMEWTQDAGGKDVYAVTGDITFFPKMITVEPRQERVIRAGVVTPATAVEKAYRLFIREAGGKKAEGNAVAIALRFGVPIFLKPAKERVSGEVRNVRISDGKVEAAVVNTGNAHFRIRKIRFSGKDAAGASVFVQDADGWYLLPGISRIHSVAIDEKVRGKVRTVDVEVDAEEAKFNAKIDVENASLPSKQ